MNKIGLDAIQRSIIDYIRELLLFFLFVLIIYIVLSEIPSLKPRLRLHTRRLVSNFFRSLSIISININLNPITTKNKNKQIKHTHNLSPIELRRLEHCILKRVNSRPNLLIDISRVVRVDAYIVRILTTTTATTRAAS